MGLDIRFGDMGAVETREKRGSHRRSSRREEDRIWNIP
jgi:hypothetical protein